MRVSIERLRWGLIAGAVVLVAMIAGAVLYGRYRALLAWNGILKRAGVSITHDTNGFTYSQSDGKRTIFTLHAVKAVPEGNGKYALHDADLLLYGRVPGAPDRIYGSDFEYDEKEGVARALGEVRMELQAPPSMGGNAGKTQPTGADTQVIHVRTSGVVYLRKLGVAATDQDVDFQWAGIHCNARGAEFNPSQSTLHLLSDVRMSGDMRNEPFTLNAAEANLDRTANIVDLSKAIIRSNGRTAQADRALGYFRKDGSIEHGWAEGNVVLTAGTQQITARRLDATLNSASQPQTARLSGGVVLLDTNPQRPIHGSTQNADATFDARGSPTSVVATGAASAVMTEHNGKGPDLTREMEGDSIVATFLPVGPKTAARLSQLHAIGSARARGDSVPAPAKAAAPVKSSGPPGPPQLKTLQVFADDLRAVFAETAHNRAQVQHVFGTGNTRLLQNAPLGEQETSTGDTLQMDFRSQPSATGQSENPAISAAVQTGHVVIHSRAAERPGATAPPAVTTAHGDRATYDAALDTLTVTGNTYFSDGQNELTAASVVIDQRTGDSEAEGNVRAAVDSAGSSPSAANGTAAAPSGSVPPSAAAPETHVLSAYAHFNRAAKLAEFRGTDADPARLWQGASQVQAAVLLFDGVRRTLTARSAAPATLIHAVFAGQPATPPGPATGHKPATQPPSVVRVASQHMDYTDVQREATFTGNVHIDGTMGEVTSERAAVFLLPAKATAPPTSPPAPPAAAEPNPLTGSIDRVVVYGKVQMEQPGRHGTGEELLYTAATASYVLTGTPEHPAHIVDAQQGNVTGATLLFVQGGSTIVVAGQPASGKTKATRVRTETEVTPRSK